ncbi:MAG TPA: hypothetical protein VIG33_08525 [Pseudobdellovibrionaceae bacterium]|jgi:hypothetical protein
MSRIPLWTSSLIISCVLLAGSGCSLFDRQLDPENAILKQSIHQKVFFAPYDSVWKAAHTSIRYPIAVENQDTGFLETEYIKGVDGFLPPEVSKPPSAGIRYKLVFNFAKGKTEGRESTRVTLEKKIERLRDFFSEADGLASDGLEEKTLFYRIEREIVIAEALKKVQ